MNTENPREGSLEEVKICIRKYKGSPARKAMRGVTGGEAAGPDRIPVEALQGYIIKHSPHKYAHSTRLS